MNQVITLDWLQLHVRQVPEDYPATAGRFTIFNTGKQTKQFKNYYLIIVGTECVATLVGRPHSGILKPDSGLLKLENKYLYQDDVKGLVNELLQELGLQFQNISRLDLACDFNMFLNGLHAERFIYKFLTGEYVKLMKSKFKTIGMHTRQNTFEYIMFGSGTSTLCYYLYNKSVEMKEQKYKPYIFDNWKNKGLNTDLEVWRLEFRIHSNPRGLVDEDTGETVPFSKLDVLDIYNEVYRALFYKYFDFRYEDGQVKKNRMKKIPLLSLEKPTTNVMRLVDKIESNRMDKIFLKKLIALNQELRGTDYDLSIYNQLQLNHFVHSRDLVEYVKNKWPSEHERMNVPLKHLGHSELHTQLIKH